LLGYNATEISKKTHENVENVRKCIQRNYSNLKLKHEGALRKRIKIKKDIRRVINYEANKCIGDKSFIMKNRSIYTTKANGDIVLSKNTAAITWDTPRRLNNEFKNCY
jgi:hypothetical protein